MIFLNRIAFHRYGIDLHIFNAWRGIYVYWQRPLLSFEIINSHRKNNTLHEYGFIVFGLWFCLKVDE